MIINPKNPDKLIKFLKEKPLILYGMGDTVRRIAQWCDTHGISYLISDKRAEELKSSFIQTVISSQSIVSEYSDANVVVSSIIYGTEITQYLLQLGVEKERIFSSGIFMPDQVSWKELEENDRAD